VPAVINAEHQPSRRGKRNFLAEVPGPDQVTQSSRAEGRRHGMGELLLYQLLDSSLCQKSTGACEGRHLEILPASKHGPDALVHHKLRTM
jgi:hypothetical protein